MHWNVYVSCATQICFGTYGRKYSSNSLSRTLVFTYRLYLRYTVSSIVYVIVTVWQMTRHQHFAVGLLKLSFLMTNHVSWMSVWDYCFHCRSLFHSTTSISLMWDHGAYLVLIQHRMVSHRILLQSCVLVGVWIVGAQHWRCRGGKSSRVVYSWQVSNHFCCLCIVASWRCVCVCKWQLKTVLFNRNCPTAHLTRLLLLTFLHLTAFLILTVRWPSFMPPKSYSYDDDDDTCEWCI